MSFMSMRPNFGLALLCTTSALALASAAQAQDTGGTSTETVVVTGSRIIADAANSPTPLTVVSSQQLLATTPGHLSEGINKLPEFIGSSGKGSQTNASAATGASNVLNLRGFGAQRTLVLMDGRRLIASNADGTTSIDTLPQMLVQRVDVVTGGASAVYGSDAVTGVVNFIIDHNFTGWKFDANAGISNYEDGASYSIGAAAGSSLFGGRGHIEGELHIYHQDPIYDSARPINNMSWGAGGTGTAANPYTVYDNLNLNNFSYGGKITCSGCSANGQQFIANGVLGPFNPGTPDGTGGISTGGDGAVSNFNTFISLVSNEDSYGRFSYNINDDTTFYVEATAAQAYTKSMFNNIYFQTGNAANQYFATNAYLPPAAQAALGSGTSSIFQMYEYLDNPNLGPWSTQITELTENNYTTTVGIDGVVFGNYNWSAYYTHGFDRLEIGSPHNLNIQRQWAANDAVTTPGGGVACYVSTTTYAYLFPGCVPINNFGRTSLTANQFNYIIGKTYGIETKDQDNLGASITGPLFNDWAGPVNAALSAEARWYDIGIVGNGLNTNVNCTGLRLCNTLSVLWQGATVNPMPTVSENVWEVAAEVGVPLIKDAPLVQSLDIDLAGRYTDYSITGSVETWKVGFDYHVNDEVRFRGTTSVDIRAPTLFDLFAPTQLTNSGYSDVHTGLGGIDRHQTAGDPNLVPEISRTYTGGVIYTPEWVSNLTFSVDYYNINMKNAISQINGADASIQNLCELANGTGPYCALIIRPLPFADRSPANFPTVLVAQSLNVAFQKTEGWDIELNYGFALGDMWADAPGTINLRMVGNVVPVMESQAFPGGPIRYTAASEAGANATSTNPAAKGRVTSFVAYNVGSWTFNLMDRWLSGFPNRALATDVIAPQNLHVNSVNYQDVTIDKKFVVDGQTVDGYFSIQNLGNVLPPINLTSFTSNTSPGTWYQGIGGGSGEESVYDPIGRYFTIGIKATL